MQQSRLMDHTGGGQSGLAPYKIFTVLLATMRYSLSLEHGDVRLMNVQSYAGAFLRSNRK